MIEEIDGVLYIWGAWARSQPVKSGPRHSMTHRAIVLKAIGKSFGQFVSDDAREAGVRTWNGAECPGCGRYSPPYRKVCGSCGAFLMSDVPQPRDDSGRGKKDSGHQYEDNPTAELVDGYLAGMKGRFPRQVRAVKAKYLMRMTDAGGADYVGVSGKTYKSMIDQVHFALWAFIESVENEV